MNPKYPMKPPNTVMIRALERLARGLFLHALVLVFLSGTCAAQSEEEMKILHMFFKDKDLFTSATRHPKPVSQIAENVTVVTGKEIEAMNAHTVAEVLNRVTGVFVNFGQGTGSFGSASLLKVQGSEERHVLVLVDGIPWNFLASGAAETNSIPVGIIDRIEIIKGPGSSSWGSSLGGVIHIITKPAGHAARPTGAVRASYGERDTQDYRAEVYGMAGKLGYYLFGGRQESERPGLSRNFDNESLYSKLTFHASDRADLGLSIGYSQPDTGLGDFAQADITSSEDRRVFWGTALLDASLTRDLALSLRLFRLQQKSTITNEVLSPGFAGLPGDLFQETVFDEETTGANGQLVWNKGKHTAVLGVELVRGKLDQTIDSGEILQGAGAPERLRTHPDIDRQAIYLNDTIVIDRLSITPGIRYDHNSITDSFISPSLGLTYRLRNETILRGSVARGFAAPPLSWVSGGAFFLDPNPSLENEKVWSYQMGLESAAFRYFWFKTTLFRHEVDEIFKKELFAAGPPSFNDLIVNNGDGRRQGFEIEAETLPVWNLSLRAGLAYVNFHPDNDIGSTDTYTYNIGVTYDDPKVFRAELFGHYVWWDAQAVSNASYDDFIWDLNFSKQIFTAERTAVELFFTGHNLFNGSQYLVEDNKNPDRWVEVGMRIRF
jgi:vitamin B12 transporter